MSKVREMLETIAKMEGYKVYTVKGHESFGFVITPLDNVLVVNKANFGNGVTFTLEYKPSQKCGSGCSCMEDDYDFGVTDITETELKGYENDGMVFARKLKAPLYKNSTEWMTTTYWKKDLEEVM